MAKFRIGATGLMLFLSWPLWAAQNDAATIARFQGGSKAPLVLAQMTHDAHAKVGGASTDNTYVYEDLKKQAEAGEPYAQYSFGQMLASGRGTPFVDFPAAYLWLSLALKGLPAGKQLTEAQTLHARIEKWMTPEQLADTKKQIENWKPAAPPSDAANSKSQQHSGMNH